MHEVKINDLSLKSNDIELDFSPQLQQAISRLMLIVLRVAGENKFLCTSGSELTSKHSKLSKHYPDNNESKKGEAIDFRSWWFTAKQREQIIKEFYDIKGFRDDYDLIWELKRDKKTKNVISEHFHLEYDPK